MKFNYLAVIAPVKWLPQNTEQAHTQMWAQVTQLMLPSLGKLYARFYPASRPWGQVIPTPFGVVLGREDPIKFLNVFYRAKREQEKFSALHMTEMLNNIDLEQTQQFGDTVVCHVTADGSNKALEGHALWHMAVMSGSIMPDCGIYYLEQKQAIISPEQEKTVTAHPGDYALCAVTLEAAGVQHET